LPPADGSAKQVNTSSYWNTIYLEQPNPRWDIGHAAPSLVHWLKSATPGRVVVPGCGFGYDVRLFASHGFSAVGADFAPLAIARARELSREARGTFEFRQVDFFDLPGTERHSFDYFYEYTSFVAIEPEQRPRYVRLALELLRPGGRLVGCFYNHGRPGGPPFDVTRDEVLALYAPHFKIEQLEITADSIERRRGHELWAEFIKPGENT
jgi:SAM-dependent methyltransferase